MSNRLRRDLEAKLVYRPVAIGQAETVVEAACAAIVQSLFRVSVLPCFPVNQMWRKK